MRSPRLWNRSVAAAAAAVVTLGVSGPAMAAIHDVIVRDFEFDPDTVTVEPGDTVRWIWESGDHTVTSGDACVADGRAVSRGLLRVVRARRSIDRWKIDSVLHNSGRGK